METWLNNALPGASETLTITGKGSRVCTRLNPPLEFDTRNHDTVVSLSNKLKETNSKPIRCNLLAVLDELLSRRGISDGDYEEIVGVMG